MEGDMSIQQARGVLSGLQRAAEGCGGGVAWLP